MTNALREVLAGVCIISFFFLPLFFEYLKLKPFVLWFAVKYAVDFGNRGFVNCLCMSFASDFIAVCS